MLEKMLGLRHESCCINTPRRGAALNPARGHRANEPTGGGGQRQSLLHNQAPASTGVRQGKASAGDALRSIFRPLAGPVSSWHGTGTGTCPFSPPREDTKARGASQWCWEGTCPRLLARGGRTHRWTDGPDRLPAAEQRLAPCPQTSSPHHFCKSLWEKSRDFGQRGAAGCLLPRSL